MRSLIITIVAIIGIITIIMKLRWSFTRMHEQLPAFAGDI